MLWAHSLDLSRSVQLPSTQLCTQILDLNVQCTGTCTLLYHIQHISPTVSYLWLLIQRPYMHMYMYVYMYMHTQYNIHVHQSAQAGRPCCAYACVCLVSNIIATSIERLSMPVILFPNKLLVILPSVVSQLAHVYVQLQHWIRVCHVWSSRHMSYYSVRDDLRFQSLSTFIEV